MTCIHTNEYYYYNKRLEENISQLATRLAILTIGDWLSDHEESGAEEYVQKCVTERENAYRTRTISVFVLVYLAFSVVAVGIVRGSAFHVGEGGCCRSPETV